MLNKVISALAGWKGYAVLGALALAAGISGGWTVRDWKAGADGEAAARAETREVIRVVYRERAQADLTTRIESAAVAAQVEIRTVTRTLIQEVPVYVTPDADDRCVVPVGFVRIHAAATAGQPLSEPAGVADDAPSGVDLSDVATVDVENAGAYHAVARQLTDLQNWIRAQQALANAP